MNRSLAIAEAVPRAQPADSSGDRSGDDTRAADALHALAARRTRLAAALTTAMMVAYVGFILLIAFDKPLAGTLLADGRVSVGILLGGGVIMLAPLLTAIYVRWANTHCDAAIARLRAGERQ